MSSTRPNIRGPAPNYNDEPSDLSDYDSDIIKAVTRHPNIEREPVSGHDYEDVSKSVKHKRKLRPRSQQFTHYDDQALGDEHEGKRQCTPVRRSGRATRHIGMMSDHITDDMLYAQAKAEEVKTREAGTAVRQFRIVPKTDCFSQAHASMCEKCGGDDTIEPFIYCQGCTFTYHQTCLGTESGRRHILLQVAEDDWVLHCKRCIGYEHKHDATAPDLGTCMDCCEHGKACQPLEQSWSPGHNIASVNDASSVLTRCWTCFRAWHTEHQPDGLSTSFRRWTCNECTAQQGVKAQAILAWCPADENKYDADFLYERLEEVDKLYLIKWRDQSYLRCDWMPGSWVWSVAARATLKAFSTSEGAHIPKRNVEDVVPKEYMLTDAILEVVTDGTAAQSLDLASHIQSIQHVLIKFKGLPYEDAAWEVAPSQNDVDLYPDFVEAYQKFWTARNMHQPRPVDVRARLMSARRRPFTSMVKKSQPSLITGGSLMQYQLDGLNWLYYQWHIQKNAILGDEMGLGKTIQVIGFLATLIQDWECCPHLLVVPNSTCENWLRELKRWAPGIRAIAYYGSKANRKIVYDHELYPDQCEDIRCHVLVTSYEAAAATNDEHMQKLLKVSWQSLIVDEGQRLKNDQSILYATLARIRFPFKVLMTGTPLQNNQRELFNLLQFLDRSADAAKLDAEYEELNQDKIEKLREMIKPCFLRRTKAEVLGFLPPICQMILPVSMPYYQKETYRTILSKNAALVRALINVKARMKQSDSVNLNNILMQLRKCLCHPYMYSKDLEPAADSPAVVHHNLMESSSKLKLLRILLPKLKTAGHRVLIFSQFLDMLDILEDFLRGEELSYRRLDGQIGSLEKQKRLDEFNAPGSDVFAFLLSTRAGGVGINLATADTVIILDPDFNPHQDLQALSRAHRIGQTKKVLCLQLVTKDSVEERIMQIGRRKLALDKALIQDMNDDRPLHEDLLTILRHGAASILKDEDDSATRLIYDDAAVDAVLASRYVEQAPVAQDAKNLWSFARVWTNQKTAEEQNVIEFEEKKASTYEEDWNSILSSREAAQSKAAKEKAAAYGRGGARTRAQVNYNLAQIDPELALDDEEPIKPSREAPSDGDFAESSADDPDSRKVKKVAKKTEVKPKALRVKAQKTSKSESAKRGPRGGLNLSSFKVTTGWATKTSKPRTKPVKKAAVSKPAVAEAEKA